MARAPGRLMVAAATLLLLVGCGEKLAAPPPPDEPATALPDETPPPAGPDGSAGTAPEGEAGADPAPIPVEPTPATPAPTPAPGRPAPTPGSTPGPDRPATTGAALPFCDIVEERLPAEECAMLRNVARGTGAFRTPERMERGKQASVTLVVSRTAGSDAPARALAGVPGKEGRFAPAVGRYIEASLLPGPGLTVTIDPATQALQDLYASDQALWRWTVTAEQTGRHDLTIRTRVMTKRADGSFAPRGTPFTDSRTVEVYVAGAAAIEETAREADRAMKAVTAPTGTLTTLLKALGGLVAAAGALWIAIKAFGRGKPDPPPGS